MQGKCAPFLWWIYGNHMQNVIYQLLYMGCYRWHVGPMGQHIQHETQWVITSIK